MSILKDNLTSFYTYEGARQLLQENHFFDKHRDAYLVLIYIAGLKEMVTEFGSTFAMAVLENQSGLIQGFFEKRGLFTVCSRITEDSFAVVYSGINDTGNKLLIESLCNKLVNSYYGRSDDMNPQIRMGVCPAPKADSDFGRMLIQAGAALSGIPEGTSGTAFFEPEMMENFTYSPVDKQRTKLPAEELTNYDREFIAFAVRMLAGSRDLDSNTDLLIQYIGWKFGFDDVILCEFEGDHHIRTTNKWLRSEGIVYPLDEYMTFDTWNGFFVDFDKRGFNITMDVEKKPFSENDKAFFRQNNIRSFINIMLYNMDTPIGYISFGKSDPMEELDSVLLSTLAHLSRIIASYVSLRIRQNKHKDRIRKLSIDPLTGLYTYAAFQRQVRHKLHHCDPDKSYAFISADISHFSNLNENFGYSEGDHVLRLFSKKIKSSNPENVISCHVEADRFLIFAENDTRESMLRDITSLCDEFEKYLEKRYPMADLRVVTGVYFVSNPNKDLLYMIDSANHTRKSIKDHHTQNVAIYSDELRARRKQMLEIVGSVHSAIEHGYIEAFLQPKFSMTKRKIIGAEALVRWRNPDNSYRYPDQFIPVLEDAGLIVDLDMCVFRQVLAALSNWQKNGKPLIPISVNFSRVHFRDENFFKKIVSITKEFGIDAKYIEVEVTESSFGENRENLYLQLEQLRKNGFLVDIDDFGTGYSSLNMLMSAPVDIVKVDKSFIDHYETKEEQKYINQIGSLILSADKDIIFEGVETEEQIQLLTNYGYDLAQGYFFSRPIPLPEFEKKYIYNDK